MEGRALVKCVFDGTPYEGKLSRTVWSGGKLGGPGKPKGDLSLYGVLATTILVDGLKRYGIECGFYIPDRIKEGYGLSEKTVQLAHQKGYEIIITVDNGVKAHDALAKAKEYGMTVIVSDHHHIEGDVDCDLLVHPTLMEDEFAYLCGASLAYEMVRALGQDTHYHLGLAAIASVADCMVVKEQTRAIIQQGLKVLNQKQDAHVFSLCNDRILNEMSIGFQIAPKINAVGRLSNLANVNNLVRYFLCDDIASLSTFSQQVLYLNDQRKQMSTSMSSRALAKIDASKPILMVSDSSFHEGMIGLVAGGLCSQFNKPVIVLAITDQGYKASMRAPDGFDCMEFLSDFDRFSAMGGHKQAAGFSVDLQEYYDFCQYVEKRGHSYVWSPLKKETIKIDPEDLTKEAIEALDVLRPFGVGFEEPLFEIENPNIRSIYDIQGGKHRKYTLASGLTCMDFNQTRENKQASVNSIVSFIGRASINNYRGQKQVNFIIQTIERT